MENPEAKKIAPKRPAAEFRNSFTQSDVDVVTRVAAYLAHSKNRVDKIAVRPLEDDPSQSIVYIRRTTEQGFVFKQVNWDQPDLNPEDYAEYARDFYFFAGLSAQQEKRADLLASVLQVPLRRMDKLPEGRVEIPSMGLILVNASGKNLIDELFGKGGTITLGATSGPRK